MSFEHEGSDPVAKDAGLIPVLQYMLPDGRERWQYVRRDHEVTEKAHEILKSGYRLEVEILTTQEVSMTVHDVEDEMDLFIEIAPNGPEVLEAFDRMVLMAYEDLVD